MTTLLTRRSARSRGLDRRWWTLIAVCGSTFMLLVDIFIVQVALPTIHRRLGGSFTDLQWVIDAYALTLAAFILTFGSLADRFGRKACSSQVLACSRPRRCCAARPSSAASDRSSGAAGPRWGSDVRDRAGADRRGPSDHDPGRLLRARRRGTQGPARQAILCREGAGTASGVCRRGSGTDHEVNICSQSRMRPGTVPGRMRLRGVATCLRFRSLSETHCISRICRCCWPAGPASWAALGLIGVALWLVAALLGLVRLDWKRPPPGKCRSSSSSWQGPACSTRPGSS